MGLGWLLNQQTLTMFLHYVVYVFSFILAFRPNNLFLSSRPVFSPCSPLFSLGHAQCGYVRIVFLPDTTILAKIGDEEVLMRTISFIIRLRLTIVHSAFQINDYIWFPHNLYFINRKLFVLTLVISLLGFAVEVFLRVVGESKKVFAHSPAPLFTSAFPRPGSVRNFAILSPCCRSYFF